MDQLLGRQAGRIFNNEAWGCHRGWKVSGTDCVGDRKLLDPKSGLGAIGTPSGCRPADTLLHTLVPPVRVR
jgi:hypothetical protein